MAGVSVTLRADQARSDPASVALAAVETQLRDLIWDRGVDPAKDAVTARLLVQEACQRTGNGPSEGTFRRSLTRHTPPSRFLFAMLHVCRVHDPCGSSSCSTL